MSHVTLTPATLAPHFPGVRALLGPEHFARLLAESFARAAELDLPPDAALHGRLVQPDAPRPAHVPARLVADVAATERALAESAQLAPATRDQPRLGPELSDWLRRPDAAHAVLQPLRALRIIPVAFRLEGWLRAVRAGRIPAHLPRREERVLLCYPLAGNRHVAPAPWLADVEPAAGRFLSLLALGTPLGEALADAAAHGLPETQAHDALLEALLEGLFTELRGD